MKKKIKTFAVKLPHNQKKMHETFFPLSSLSLQIKTIADSGDDEIFRNNNKEQK